MSMVDDAARYRWLREQESVYFEGISFDWSGGYDPAGFDVAVDRAMKEEREKQQSPQEQSK